jgi:hypothetical protein
MTAPDSMAAKGGFGNERHSRQVYELTLDDLDHSPIWEFRLDATDEKSQDESTVRPYTASSPLDPAGRMFIVRAAFTLADGSKMKGYLTPPGRGDSNLGQVQPIIISSRGQVRFWCGTGTFDSKRLARNYDFLGKDAQHLFPLRFESEVEIAGGPVSGTLPGFLVLEDFQTRKTRTVW